MLNKEFSMDLLTQLGEELFWKDMEKSDKYLETNKRIKKTVKNIEILINKVEDLELKSELEKEFGWIDEIFFDRQACVFDYVLPRAIALGYSMAGFETTLEKFLKIHLK